MTHGHILFFKDFFDQRPIGLSRCSQTPSATSSSSNMVLAVLPMVELGEVTEGVRRHRDPPGTTLFRFAFELRVSKSTLIMLGLF